MPTAQSLSLNDALDLFLLDREAQNLAEKTLHTYRVRLTKFVAWCREQGVSAIDDLTHGHIRQYQAHLVKTMADTSAKNRIVSIKTFLKFCVTDELIKVTTVDSRHTLMARTHSRD
jgi:site-specific recombinase XerD